MVPKTFKSAYFMIDKQVDKQNFYQIDSSVTYVGQIEDLSKKGLDSYFSLETLFSITWLIHHNRA